jgi:hypothetical protein
MANLLSPNALSKIEQKNLYNKQLNSFYAPRDCLLSINNSAVNPDRMHVNELASQGNLI